MSIPSTHDRLAYYAKTYAGLTVNPSSIAEAKSVAGIINQNIATYGMIAKPFSIPAWVVGIMHHMESGSDFETHLANGDPLSKDTVDVPADLMAKYRPDLKAPFEFIPAAFAALQDYKEGWNQLVITDVVTALQVLDQWNGVGYWNHMQAANPVPQNPYLFSGTSAYTAGKFISDNNWSDTAVSAQVGCAAIMRALNL